MNDGVQTPEPQPNRPEDVPADRGIVGLRATLARLRSAIRAQLITSRLGMIVASIVGAGLVWGLLDWSLRFPTAVRCVVWVAGVAALVYAVRRHVLPALRFRPTEAQLALRLEESRPGRELGWKGLLTSGLELSGSTSNAEDAQLRRAAVDEATRRFGSARVNVLALLDPATLRRALAAMAVAGAAVLSLSLTRPDLLRIGTLRVAAPWAGAQWPKRTGVVHASRPEAHALGAAFPLRALLVRSTGGAEQTRVAVNYRVVADGREGAWQRALLTPQGKKAKSVGEAGERSVEGDLFERFLDTQGLAAEGAERVMLEYVFETEDDQTDPWRVALVPVPRVVAARVNITPPSYIDALPGAPTVLRGEVDAGVGTDARSTIGLVLAGSRVEMTVEFNKPLPVNAETGGAAWADAALSGITAHARDVIAAAEPTRWRVAFTPERSLRVAVRPTDQFGIEAGDDALFRFEVAEDGPPSAGVVQPAQDEAVLTTAVIGAAGEGRDDVGLSRVALRTQEARVDPASAGGAAEPVGEPAEAAFLSPGAPDDPRTVRAASVLALADRNFKPGDELWLTATALDALGAATGAEPVVSPVRRLKIISESELTEQVRAEMTGLRDAARRLEQEQQRLLEELAGARPGDAASADIASRQTQLARRLAPVSQSVQRLADRVARNNLDNQPLKDLLTDAKETADRAQAEAGDAGDQTGRFAREQDAASAEVARAGARASQEQAREELSALVEMLNQDQGEWAVRRSVEQLLAEQRQVRAQTRATGGQTQGRSAAELSQSEREDLERIARRQDELAQRASRALDDLEERARAMQEAAPEQARSLQQAASKARAAQLTQKQQQAAQQIQQNQTGQAQENQQRAEEALQEALDALDDVQQARDERLQRVLADIAQSLDQLIARQERELEKLGAALAGENAPGLDASLASLHQNTLGVLALVRREAEDAAKLASLVDAAAGAQAAGVVALRTQPPDLGEADAMERTSLARLREARDEAQRLADEAAQRDQDRVRRRLRQKYAEAMEQVAAARERTAPLVGDTDRRARASARAVAGTLGQVRAALADVRAGTEELADAAVFDYAHTRIDRDLARAAEVLNADGATPGVLRSEDGVIATLRSLVEALRDNKKDDGLQDAAGGGGGGSGGQPQPAIPPLAELIVLRGLQEQAALRTRSVGDDVEAGNTTEDLTRELADVADLQKGVTEQGESLLKKLQNQNPPRPVPAPQDDEADKPEEATP
ncbi:MAG TPA: hypothetical protein VD971_06725 [Phycisphaerales bacterium]|nr:hypothetical protein [Phycisphaerales bacterium]